MTRALVAGAGLLACRPIPTHNGYTSSEPWKTAAPLELGADGELGLPGQTLSYGKRHRARWYRVSLPADGEMTLSIDVTPRSDRERLTVAAELLDSGYRQLIAAAPTSSPGDDAFAPELAATASDLPRGTYYLHVYVGGRLDEADFDLALRFRSAAIKRRRDIEVTLLDPLPVVPVLDEESLDCGRCNCRRDAWCNGACRKCRGAKSPPP